MPSVQNNKEPIVVVDDDQGILDSFDVMLGDDYSLLTADNGNRAIDLILETVPPLLFLDIKIPGPNGLEVLQKIKARGIPTKVVVVTALPQDQFEEQARRYGVYRYLHKPLDVYEIEEIARHVLQ